MKITKTCRKALEILKSKPGITAGDFAVEMWPESLMHRRVSNQGNGACRGKAAWLAAGSYLAKLRYRGLVRDSNIKGSYARCYFITGDGLDAIHA